MLTFEFTNADGIMTETERLTSGMVGKKVKFTFSSDWEGLRKTAVFSDGYITRVVENLISEAVIPAAVLETPGRTLTIGIYGESEYGDQIIPTILVAGPVIERGANPYAQPISQRHSGVRQLGSNLDTRQLQEQIGVMELLETQEKDNLVEAINQLNAQVNKPDPSGGMWEEVKSLLMSILRNAVYASDQTENLEALHAAFTYVPDDDGDSEEPETGSFAFEFVQGAIALTPPYLKDSYIRVSDISSRPVLTAGKTYRLIGLNGVDYGIREIYTSGAAMMAQGETVDNSYWKDHGWQQSGYEFIAKEDVAYIFLTASYYSTGGSTITPAEAMPVTLELVEEGSVEEPEDTAVYTVIYHMTQVATDNTQRLVAENDAYNAQLTAADGYVLDSVKVVMGGNDVTADTYLGDGVIKITNVYGDVTITATAIEEQYDSGMTFTLEPIKIEVAPPYYSDATIRASDITTRPVLTPGKQYRLVGVDGVRYGLREIYNAGAELMAAGETISGTYWKDHGWQSSGYVFTALADVAYVFLTASFTSGAITPEQAMPVYLEEVTE